MKNQKQINIKTKNQNKNQISKNKIKAQKISNGKLKPIHYKRYAKHNTLKTEN